MDNIEAVAFLREGAGKLGVTLGEEATEKLLRLRDELLKWNRKVNLTAITEPSEVLEKHFLDSLAVAPEVEGAKQLLDLGAGAGFPGLPLRIHRPELTVTLVDAVAKKVGYMKHAIALLGLSANTRAVHGRAEGKPDAEGLPRADVVISRALMDLPQWAALGSAYLAEGGRLVAMLGQAPDEAALEEARRAGGFAKVTVRAYSLPHSHAGRHVAVLSR